MIAAAGTATQSLACVALAATAAGWLLAAQPRLRATAGALALLLGPAALLLSVLGDDEASLPELSPAIWIAAVLAAAGALAVAGALCLRFERWVVPAAIVVLPFRVPIAVGGESVKLLLPLYVVIGGAVAAYGWRAWRGDAPAPRAPRMLDVLLAAYFAVYALQAAYSPDASVALQNIAFFYVPFALLYGLAAAQRWDARQLRVIVAAVVAVALVLVAVGFVEFARGEYLLRPGGIKPNDFDPYFRVQSLFFDPNIFGRFLALVMLTVASLMVYTRRTGRVLASAVVLAVLWAGLVLTLSQSSFAALLAGLIALAAMRWNTRRVLIATAVVALAGMVFAVAMPSVSGIDLGDSRSAETSTSGRFDLVTGAFRLWGERPLVGQGSGGFAASFERESLAEDSAYGSPSTTKSHTAPLTVAAEQGLLGLLLFVPLLWFSFKAVFRRTGGDDDRPGAVARVAVAAAFTALFVHSLVYAALFEDPLTWVLLGMAVSLAAIPRNGEAAAGEASSGDEPAPECDAPGEAAA